MKFAAEVYAGDIYVGKISANSFPALKRLASGKCNNYFHVIDTMAVYRFNDVDTDKAIRFTRVNRKAPNNTMIRGCWR